MKIIQITAPTIEPITLAELKLHLRLDSGSFADNVDENQSIAPGDHVVAASYSLEGTGIDVLGYTAIVVLNSGTNGASGTVDVKIQESDDDVTYTDWSAGAFTQVTEANDNAIQEKEYTGVKQYIRTVATVAVATCDFGTTVIRLTGDSTLDDELTDAIVAGRKEIENITRRALLTQTWDYYLDQFPAEDYIKLPFGNLQDDSETQYIKYTDSGGDQTTMTENTDYLWETNGEACGRIVLPYGESWPSFTPYPSNPIVIRFKCGWTAAANIPRDLKQAVKFAAQDDYYYGDRHDILNKIIMHKTASYCLWDEF